MENITVLELFSMLEDDEEIKLSRSLNQQYDMEIRKINKEVNIAIKVYFTIEQLGAKKFDMVKSAIRKCLCQLREHEEEEL